jgi:diphthine-ammonia ligase
MIGSLIKAQIDSCNRLGLVPIAYLWERNQEELLYEMIAAGMDSILLKVAGAG